MLDFAVDAVLDQAYVINLAILKYQQECPRLAPVMDLPLLDGQITHTLQGLRELLAKIREISLSAQRGETSIAYVIPLGEAMRFICGSTHSRSWRIGNENAIRIRTTNQKALPGLRPLHGGVCSGCISFKVLFRAPCS